MNAVPSPKPTLRGRAVERALSQQEARRGQILFQTPDSNIAVPISVTCGTNFLRQIDPIPFTVPFGGANPLSQVLSIAASDQTE